MAFITAAEAGATTECHFRVNDKRHSCRQKRRVTERCPLSPVLSCVAYEPLHGTLAKEFPAAKSFTQSRVCISRYTD